MNICVEARTELVLYTTTDYLFLDKMISHQTVRQSFLSLDLIFNRKKRVESHFLLKQNLFQKDVFPN